MRSHWATPEHGFSSDCFPRTITPYPSGDLKQLQIHCLRLESLLSLYWGFLQTMGRFALFWDETLYQPFQSHKYTSLEKTKHKNVGLGLNCQHDTVQNHELVLQVCESSSHKCVSFLFLVSVSSINETLWRIYDTNLCYIIGAWKIILDDGYVDIRM